jgi:hypothetical protein
LGAHASHFVRLPGKAPGSIRCGKRVAFKLLPAPTALTSPNRSFTRYMTIRLARRTARWRPAA